MVLTSLIKSHCASSPSSRDECRTAPDGYQPLDQADRLEPVGSYETTSTIAIIITQPES